ncbi:MAG: HK97 family phage prohead protease [Shewanella sp.]
MGDAKNNIEALERRLYRIELRSTDSGDTTMKVGGLASVFNKYADIGWYLERIMPGAFDGADMSDVVCLFNHKLDYLLARTTNGTLTLRVDAEGLQYDANIADTNCGRDVYALIQRGDLSQSSFGFYVAEQVWREVDRSTLIGLVADDILERLSYGGKVEIREITKIKRLQDVSPVTFPAYADTTVAQRSRDEQLAQREASASVTADRNRDIAVAIAQAQARADRFTKR